MLLSEMLGVERDTDFMVKGYSLIFQISLYTDGSDKTYERLITVDENGRVFSLTPGMAYYAIGIAPAGIIHLPPPLTDEQREQLGALYKIGYRYLTRTISITIVAHVVKPRQVMNEWIQGGLHAYIPYENSSVYRLPIKNDTEPYDIAKALGVEE